MDRMQTDAERLEDVQEEFDALLKEDGIILLMFEMSQELQELPETKDSEKQMLSIIMGNSFALLNAINIYKEIRKNGKSVKHGIRIKNSEVRS